MILIQSSINFTPEEKLNERLVPLLAAGYRIVSANTTQALMGEMDLYNKKGTAIDMYGVAHHVYYVTTVVLEKPSS